MRTSLREAFMTSAVISAAALGLLLMAGPASADDLELDPRFAREYAARFEVTEEEAAWRLSLQDSVDVIRERARAAQPEAFADIRIQHEPEYAVVISTAEPDGLDAGTLTLGTHLTNDVLHFEHVDNPSRERPEAPASGFSQPSTSIYAGLPIQSSNGSPRCTSGFSVTHTSGAEGVTTAGHCPDQLLYNGTELTFQAEARSHSSDVQWHTVPDALTIRPWARDNFPFGSPPFARVISSSVTRSSQDIGDFVCKYGRVTGFGCGVIVSRTRCPDWVPSCLSTFIQVDGGSTDLASGGDSGGPVFFGTQAWGLISGAAGANNVDDLIYMPINYIWRLGLTVLTS